MMGERTVMQDALFYSFNLERHMPSDHLLRKINRFVDLSGVRAHLEPYYSEVGRPSIDPELMIRMLLVGYCYGIRSSGGCVTRFTSIWPIAGSVGWASRRRTRPLDVLQEPPWPLPRQRSSTSTVREVVVRCMTEGWWVAKPSPSTPAGCGRRSSSTRGGEFRRVSPDLEPSGHGVSRRS